MKEICTKIYHHHHHHHHHLSITVLRQQRSCHWQLFVRSMFMRATLPYNINHPTRLTPQARLLMSSQKRKIETHNPHEDDGHNQARLSNNFQHKPIVTMSGIYSTSRNSLRIAHLKVWPNGQKKPAQGAYTQVCKTTHIYSLYFQTLAQELLSLRTHC